MTEEVKWIVDRLKYLCGAACAYHINNYVMGMEISEFEATMAQATKLIESLSAELAAAKLDIKKLIVIGNNSACRFCKWSTGDAVLRCTLPDGKECINCAEWRGIHEKQEESK